MNRKLVLTPKTIEHIKKIRRTDILVGIPSYNNEDTIGHVVNADENYETDITQSTSQASQVYPGEYKGDDVEEKTSFISFRQKTKTPVTMEELLDKVEKERKTARSPQEELPLHAKSTAGLDLSQESPVYFPATSKVEEIMQVENNTYLIIIGENGLSNYNITPLETRDLGETVKDRG